MLYPVPSRPKSMKVEELMAVFFLDCRHLGERVIREKLSQISDLARDFASVNMANEPVPIRPGMHYQMGGIKTDVNGLTAVPGLYAAGETACVSVHGGNRLGANSLLDTLVFGRRSGEHASDRAKQLCHKPLSGDPARSESENIQKLLDQDGGNESFGKLRLEMGEAMNNHLAVYRDQKGIEEALSKLLELKERYMSVVVDDKGKTFNTNLVFTLELGFMLDCAETIAVSAMERKESRGAHTRTDMPERDDENWLKHILVTSTSKGPKVDYLPVVITQWKPQIRTY